jgi:hypothetical protein
MVRGKAQTEKPVGLSAGFFIFSIWLDTGISIAFFSDNNNETTEELLEI